MNSEGHRANILNNDFQKLGVGYIHDDSSDYKYYWVQMFGSTLYSPAPTIISAADMAAAGYTGSEDPSVPANPVTLTAGNDIYTNSVVGAGATVLALAGNDSISNTYAYVSINGATGNDTVRNSGTKVTILGGDGNDKIINSGSSAKINAGTGNDSIKNTAASVSIVGGAGKDSITNTKTKVTINAGDDNDRIVNSAASVSIISGTGNDLVSIGANAKNNVITYSAGNDSLWGGKGNDTLTGGSGADVFIYESGNDVITGFANNDLLQITGTFSATYSKSANTIAFKVGSTANAITLQDFTATTFNINSFNYKISGTKLVKK